MDIVKEDMNYYAVVIGDWHFNSLGVVRSLGENGVKVYFINYSSFGYAQTSRYVFKYFNVNDNNQVIDTLGKIASENNGIGVVFPCSDEAALMLDKNYNKLTEFIVPGAGGKLEYYMDKDKMCSLASESGFKIPQSQIMDFSVTDGDEFPDIKLPVIIKPLASLDGRKADIRVCDDTDSLKSAVKDFRKSGYKRILIQQFLKSDNEIMVEYCGCKVKGEPVYCYGQLEKIREYPPDRGSTSYAGIVTDITYIDKKNLDLFLEKTGFEGLFDLEIKVVDNIPWFIEINFRNGAPAYGFTCAGFNAAYIWFCRKTDQCVTALNLKPVKLMSERDDLNHVKDKNIGLVKWLKDVSQTDVFMIFNRKDREPFRQAYNRTVDAAVSIFGRKLR